MPQTKYLLAIHRGLNLTVPRFQKLKAHFNDDWGQCFTGKFQDWQAAGIDKRGIEKWFSLSQKPSPEVENEKIQQYGAQVLVLGNADYPIPLSQIHSPPVMLFVRGSLTDQDWPSLAVVGSRRVSQYGKRALEKILPPVAQAGLTIVSGLAYGVDTIAHEIALENQARTIAPKVRTLNLPTQGIESDILKAFGIESQQHIDEITRRSSFPSTTISSHLMLMEMKGWVKNLGGQVYAKNV